MISASSVGVDAPRRTRAGGIVDYPATGAIKGMLRTLDPHRSYLTPDMMKQVEVETKGVFGGLGIEIGVKEGILTVIAPIEDTPAFRAGLKAGGQIGRIEKEPAKGPNGQ